MNIKGTRRKGYACTYNKVGRWGYIIVGMGATDASSFASEYSRIQMEDNGRAWLYLQLCQWDRRAGLYTAAHVA